MVDGLAVIRQLLEHKYHGIAPPKRSGKARQIQGTVQTINEQETQKERHKALLAYIHAHQIQRQKV
jgi:hypothetical protein